MNNLIDQDSQSSKPVDPADTLQQVGSQLQAIRTEQKLGLEEVAERLRLAPEIVSAIESGDGSRLPAMTYVRGYIRSYARLLNADEQGLLAQLGEASSEIKRPLAVKQSIRYRSPVSLPSGKWFTRILMLFAVAGLLIFGYPTIERLLSSRDRPADTPQLQLPQLDSQTDIPLPTVTTQENSNTAEMSTSPVVDEAVQPDSAPAQLATAEVLEQSQKSSSPVELTLHCKEDSWVEVTAEGKKYLAGIMRAGTSEIIKARPPFDILIGNAPSIDIEYNGVPFDTTPFRRGKVVRFTLNN